ncbi:MAG: SDR family NAD(P)-dependent oxidoreductase [Rhizobiaceae bacterium]
MALNGKSAIVTGGASGVGYAVAERLVRGGARVIFADIDMDAGREAEKRLSTLGAAIFVKSDVSRRLDVHNLVASALNLHGGVDVLVTAAAHRRPVGFLDLREDQLDRAVAVNLKGLFLPAQAVGRCLAEQVDAGGEPGSIIAVGRLDGDAASADFAWQVTRAAIHEMVRALAAALSRWRIRVNAIGVEGPAMTGTTDVDEAVAATAEWLASGGAGDLSGAILTPGEAGSH